VTGAVSRLSPRDFLRPTLTDDWCVSDVLFHLLLDAQRALVTFATPSAAIPDVDAVTYWRLRSDADGADGADVAAHARYVRLSAAAYRSPAGLVQQWTDTSEAALRAACAADPAGSVATQGHQLTVADFVGTLVVEATIHYLDLTTHLPAAAPADPVGLIVVRHTVEAPLQAPLPSSWSDLKCALVGSGRHPLEASDRQGLGDAAGRFPLIR
jgi:hypothetical protein